VNDAATQGTHRANSGVGAVCWLRIIWLGRKGLSSFFQLLGAAALLVFALADVFELLGAFPRMGWGSESSLGHYLDLLCAIVGITLFSLGYLLHAVDTRVEKKKSK
jgi:hypothetical protein